MTAQELIAKVLELERCTKMLKQDRLRRMGRFAPSLARVARIAIAQRDTFLKGLVVEQDPSEAERYIKMVNAELDRIAKGEG